MMRFPVLALVALSLVGAGQGKACTIVPPPVEKTASQVAAEGVLVRGTLIQEFDAKKQQPEMIRADEIFIGEGKPRNFVIYRPRSAYNSAWNLPVIACNNSTSFKKGHVFDRLVLMPAKGTDPAVNGRWRFETFSGHVVRGPGLELLIEEATKLGRFQKRPPHDPDRGD